MVVSNRCFAKAENRNSVAARSEEDGANYLKLPRGIP